MKNNELPSDEIQFKIHDVAKLIGVTPSTLRNWEKQGFYIPRRTQNGYRVFSYEEIELLKNIKEWSVDRRMGAEAIRMMIAGSPAPSIPTPLEEKSSIPKDLIGSHFKKRRLKQGKTLKEVAMEVQLSQAQLSKIENMQTTASVDALQRLADYYGDNLLAYLPKKKSTDASLVRKHDRVVLHDKEHGITIADLLARDDLNLSFMSYTIAPGAKRWSQNSHLGSEIVFVLSGQITFRIGNKTYQLSTGDCLTYNSAENHTWINEGMKDTKLLWIYERGGTVK